MKIRTLIIIFLTVVSSNTLAEEMLCGKVGSKGEGHWPLSEDAFTKDRYMKASAYLNNLSTKDSIVADYVNVENEIMYIKGYFLKLYAKSGDKILLKEFCNFIKNEAYVRH